ncbi:hypothetical protein [Escherichia coli]|uniref:hypothetical protein n=1 Tax=Escherichia coli TaxID=562 RepID=UPI002227886D|nr:hypothetical protein [Escherichia coli]MCW3365105.1 hypothetical protein [Escherichia coli]
MPLTRSVAVIQQMHWLKMPGRPWWDDLCRWPVGSAGGGFRTGTLLPRGRQSRLTGLSFIDRDRRRGLAANLMSAAMKPVVV